jgi:alanine racemase
MPRTKKLAGQITGRPVWAEVSLSALSYNFHAIRKFVNPPGEKRKTPRKILSIVKGNAYGHGGPEIAQALAKDGSDWFGVTSVGEAKVVRKYGVRQPILLLTGFWPGEEAEIVKHKLTPAVHRCEQLPLLERAAARRGRKISFHLKIDTGMNRLGISTSDIDCFARQFAKCKQLQLTGVFTHFASSESFAKTFAGEQTPHQEENFFAAVDRLRTLGIDPGLIHLANSGGIVCRPESWADMVRPGAILYGYHPGYEPVERRPEIEACLPLKPVMSLRAAIASLRNVPAGAGVGYGASWIAPRASRIAVLTAGYGDGIHRSLGNRGSVLVDGRLAPIVGIVSMDVCMLDVTDVPEVKVGDVATIHGTDGEHTHPANQIARSIGTVTSDLLCAVSRRVPRIYIS